MEDIVNGKVYQLAHGSKAVLMMLTHIIQPFAPVYGTSVVTYTLRAYLKAGWTFYIVAGFKPKPVDNELVKQLHISWFGGSLLDTLRILGERVRKIGFFFRAVWWVIAQALFFINGFCIISQRKVDLIYTWGEFASPAAWALSKLFGIPWVARYLGTYVPICDQKKKVLWRIRFWQEILAYKLPADLIIMTNDGTQGDRVLQHMGVKMEKVRFWLNGVNWESFHFMPQSQEAKALLNLGDKYVLLCLSRLHRWKRVDRALQALPSVLKSFSNVVLVIVGDGPERKRLEQLALELGCREHVRFEGAIPHSEVPKYLAAADIFLSLYDLSNVVNPLFEAMMAGKCIVTLNNGDTRRFIRNGENGVLLECEDLHKLPEVIKELLANEELRNRLGTNARRFAEENFWSWEERLDVEIAEVSRLVEQQEKRRYGYGTE